MLPELKRRPGLTTWFPAVNSVFGPSDSLPTQSSAQDIPLEEQDASLTPVAGREEDKSDPNANPSGATAFAFASYDEYAKNATDADLKVRKAEGITSTQPDIHSLMFASNAEWETQNVLNPMAAGERTSTWA